MTNTHALCNWYRSLEKRQCSNAKYVLSLYFSQPEERDALMKTKSAMNIIGLNITIIWSQAILASSLTYKLPSCGVLLAPFRTNLCGLNPLRPRGSLYTVNITMFYYYLYFFFMFYTLHLMVIFMYSSHYK